MRILLLIIFFPLLSQAYPDFISFGYRTCITCHYNGQGGGALNDYGRAVWASEIASHALSSQTADQLGESSGFFGKTELPWWVRPGFKYRGLFLRTALGSAQKVDRWIHMQAEANVAIHLDKKYEKVIVANYGYTPTPNRFRSSNEPRPPNWVSREYYFRWQLERKQFLYIGLMDKFYGIKHPDHTAFNRDLIRNSQNDQTHGIAYQYLAQDFDISAHVFAGNLGQTADLRQSGASGIFEYALDKETTIGTTAQYLLNQYSEQKTYGILSRISFAKGKSFLFEWGLKDNVAKLRGTSEKGYYGFMQGMVGMVQGYSLLTTFQTHKPEMTSSSPVANRVSIGGLFFPYPKTEFRFEVVNNRTSTPENTSGDQWSLLAQVHLAL